MKSVIIFLSVVLVLSLFGLCITYDEMRARGLEVSRLGSSLEAATSDCVRYKNAAGDSVVSALALRLKTDELKKYNAELADMIKTLSLRSKDVLAAGSTTAKIAIDKPADAKQMASGDLYPRNIAYRDAHNSIKCTVYKDSARLSYAGTDTITAIVHVERKKFLFFKLKKVKRTWHTIVNKNKNISLTPRISVVFD